MCMIKAILIFSVLKFNDAIRNDTNMRDSRLRHNHSTYLAFNDRRQLDRLWLPDLYFANSKSAEYNYVTIPNYVLKIKQGGECRLSIRHDYRLSISGSSSDQHDFRVHLKVSCHMDLKGYPIDKQTCFLKVVSYGSTTDRMKTNWVNGTEPPITKNPEIMSTDLNVNIITASYCDGKYFEMEFTCLLATFHLQRDIGYSLLQTYAPTTFIVVISWMAFWIDPNSVPGRVGLSVTALLTLSTHAIGMHYQLPPVSYAKAQDVWFGMCICFLFASLVEFALVNMFTRRAENLIVKLRAGGQKNGSPSKPLINGYPDDSQILNELALRHRKKALQIDRYSRILFPSAFAVFCIIYWCVYLLIIVA